MNIGDLAEKIKYGYEISREETLELAYSSSTEALSTYAGEFREQFCGRDFNLCTIINGKSGRCSENCAYCAQSAWFNTCVEEYPLLPEKTVVESARSNYRQGVHRFRL